jgi:hypothetical protein
VRRGRERKRDGKRMRDEGGLEERRVEEGERE